MADSGGWSKLPHAIVKAMPLMSLPELACTLLLVRETAGWHRRQTRLTQKDFGELTAIKSRATVGAALKAVEARGFFRRTGERSVWRVGDLCEVPDQTAAMVVAGNYTDRDDSPQPVAGSGSPLSSKKAAGPSVPDLQRQIAQLQGSIAKLEHALATLMESKPDCVSAEDDPNPPENNSNSEALRSISVPISSTTEPKAAKNGSTGDRNDPANRSIADQELRQKRSNIDPFLTNKERSPSGEKRERETKETPLLPRTLAPNVSNLQISPAAAPQPRNAEERELAAHPAAAAWLQAGLVWPGWERLKLIIQRIGPQPRAEALRKARDLWLMAGYREGNIAGILDWYEAICRDPAWIPYPRAQSVASQRPSAANGRGSSTMQMLQLFREEENRRSESESVSNKMQLNASIERFNAQ